MNHWVDHIYVRESSSVNFFLLILHIYIFFLLLQILNWKLIYLKFKVQIQNELFILNANILSDDVNSAQHPRPSTAYVCNILKWIVWLTNRMCVWDINLHWLINIKSGRCVACADMNRTFRHTLYYELSTRSNLWYRFVFVRKKTNQQHQQQQINI